MRLALSGRLEAADTTRRTITGRVVTYGEEATPGGVNMPVVFERDSVEFTNDVVFRLEHNHQAPIGRAVTFTKHDDGIDGTFRVIATRAGDDALIEASENLRGGLSVGAEILDHEIVAGVMHIRAARVDEVSLVVDPAISTARVERVAASNPTEGETQVSEQPIDPTEVDEVVVEETVEETVITASASRLAPIAPARTTPRQQFANAGEYAVAYIAAANGNRDAMQRITAANQTIADNPGIVPTPILGNLISYLAQDRPVMSSGRSMSMPSAGSTFIRPRVTQHTLMGKQAKEIDPLASQTLKTEAVTVTKGTYGGTLKISFQDAAWSTPAIMQAVMEDLALEYGMQTESVAATALSTGVTAKVDLKAAYVAADLIKAIADASAAVYAASYRTPDTIWMSPDKWAEYSAVCDTTGRPLFPHLGATNAAGTASATSMSLPVQGLNSVVSYGLPKGTVIVGKREAFEVYETTGGALSLVNVSTLSTDVAFYGYTANLVAYPGAFCKIAAAA